MDHRIGPDDFLLQPVVDAGYGSLPAGQIGLRVIADHGRIETDRRIGLNARAKHEGQDKNEGETQYRKHDPSPHRKLHATVLNLWPQLQTRNGPSAGDGIANV